MADTPPSRWTAVRGVLLDVAPSLIAYYGLRAAGTSEYTALLAATVLAGVKVSVDAIRARRLDPFAAYLMISFGLSLIVGLATSDARLLMAGNALVGGIGALAFLGSCVVGTPLTKVVAERAGTVANVPPEVAAVVRRLHVQLSALWGVGLLISTAASLVIIFALPVDVAKGLDTAVSLATTAALIVATLLLVKRMVRRQRGADDTVAHPAANSSTGS